MTLNKYSASAPPLHPQNSCFSGWLTDVRKKSKRTCGNSLKIHLSQIEISISTILWTFSYSSGFLSINITILELACIYDYFKIHVYLPLFKIIFFYFYLVLQNNLSNEEMVLIHEILITVVTYVLFNWICNAKSMYFFYFISETNVYFS